MVEIIALLFLLTLVVLASTFIRSTRLIIAITILAPNHIKLRHARWALGICALLLFALVGIIAPPTFTHKQIVQAGRIGCQTDKPEIAKLLLDSHDAELFKREFKQFQPQLEADTKRQLAIELKLSKNEASRLYDQMKHDDDNNDWVGCQ